MGLYRVKKDFESPEYGVFTKDSERGLPDNIARAWVDSGLLEEMKKKEKVDKGGLNG